jgi:hypothetical protein
MLRKYKTRQNKTTVSQELAVIPATQDAEIRRISVQSHPRDLVLETLS